MCGSAAADTYTWKRKNPAYLMIKRDFLFQFNKFLLTSPGFTGINIRLEITTEQ